MLKFFWCTESRHVAIANEVSATCRGLTLVLLQTGLASLCPGRCTAVRPSNAAIVSPVPRIQRSRAAVCALGGLELPARLWPLVGAFALGGATTAAASAAAGSFRTRVPAPRGLLLSVFRRSLRIVRSVLGAACMALLRRRLPGCEAADEGECDLAVSRSRWAEAWAILRAGLREVGRTTAEGVEAFKMERSLYSAVLGRSAHSPAIFIAATRLAALLQDTSLIPP